MSQPSNTKRRGRKRGAIARRRAFLAAVWVLLLALVVVIGVALSAPRQGVDVVELPAAQAGEKLYADALDAYRSGETSTAIALLQASLDEDPSNAAAVQLLETLVHQPAELVDTSPPSGSSDEEEPSIDETPFLEDHEDLTVLLPSDVEGFRLGFLDITADDAQVVAQVTDVALSHTVQKALIAVHDRGSVEGADTYIARVSRQLFAEETASLDIFGAEAHFGTDGGLGATIAFSRGRYVFEAILTIEGGTTEAVMAVAEDIAKSYPTSP